MTKPLHAAFSRIADRLRDGLKRHPCIAFPPLPGAAEAMVAIAAAGNPMPLVMAVTPSRDDLDRLHRDATTLAPYGDATVHYFPAREGEDDDDPELTGYRLQTLAFLQGPIPEGRHVVVTEIRALMQASPSPAQLADSCQILTTGANVALAQLTLALEAGGYTFTDRVTSKGEAAVRGGIFDVWPPTEAWPVRVELFGPEIDSLRHFDPGTQATIAHIDRVTLQAAGEKRHLECLTPETGVSTPLDFLPPDTLIFMAGSLHVRAVADRLSGHLQRDAADTPTAPPNATLPRLQRFARIETDSEVPAGENAAVFEYLPPLLRIPFVPDQPDRMEQARRQMIDELDRQTLTDCRTVRIFVDTPGALQHLQSMLTPARRKRFAPCVGPLSEGFVAPDLNLVLVTESDLYGKRKSLTERYDPAPQQQRAGRFAGERISDLGDLEIGDLVVHVEHGIGRYLGVQEIRFNHQDQEVIAIAYADDQKLYVPMGHAHLLTRYVGVAGQTVRLHRLGGQRWGRDKAAAEAAVMDLSANLLDLQAARNLLTGFAFPADTAWQGEFENAFPFQETADQSRVIAEVKADMESTRPMDRLVCGDAGYGKTEVAMRAAFKAATAGKQVAVLVPTTVLAQQHYRTFTERMNGYPIRIEVLSRLVPLGRRQTIMNDARRGRVDILIGTHAMLHASMRFANLGLVVIDEEQRFGVLHKERLKRMKQLVDVLTLTATPIPRTLYLSLTGTRDMSLLRTPPRERVAVETIVCKDHDDTIRQAIQRELDRDGQVFFLYNRVRTIKRMEQRLQRLVPDTSIAVAHGQMPSAGLAAVMRHFTDGQASILLCTTIIESGMDIPRANTILIDRADRFGLADLYQLRGRVGRSSHKAYAYFLLPSHGYIDADARARIGAIRKFSSLSAGFNLALRDLELRGAGNILGAAQSGHIGAVGFGLYCRLLKRAIAQRKGEPPPRLAETEIALDFLKLAPSTDHQAAACIPYSYIEDERERIDLYRRLAETVAFHEIDSIASECRDRFGPLPRAIERVLQLCRIRILASERGISRIAIRDGRLALLRHGDYVTQAGRLPSLAGTTPDEKLAAIEKTLIDMSPSPAASPPPPHRTSPLHRPTQTLRLR